VVEELVNDAVQRQYTYGLQLISENQLISNTWTASFYETDGAGNVRQLTNSAGAVTDSYEYDAFGNEVNSTGSTSNNYLYRGEQWDPDLGAYYLRHRYYNPVTGRFLSADSLANKGQRRYEYAAADPVNGMDPTGNEDIIEYALLIHFPPPILWHPKLDWCGLPIVGSYLPGCDKPGPGAPPPPPPPCNINQPNCCPQCFAQLKYRSVYALGVNTGKNHAFWYVGDGTGSTEIIDAGPADPDCSPYHRCGLLIDWPPFGPSGHYREDNPGAATAWTAPQSNQLSTEVFFLEFSAATWNSNNPNTWYVIDGAPNSNTFAHDMANDAGFTNVTAPPSAPGW